MLFKLFITFLLFFSNTTQTNIEIIRQTYERSEADSKSADKLKDLTASQSNALVKAYHGVSYAFLAKHGSNPLSKLSNLKKGLNIMNLAVKQDAKDVEVRFLRYSVESNIPGFVSFENHTATDKKFINENLTAKHEYFKVINAFMKSK